MGDFSLEPFYLNAVRKRKRKKYLRCLGLIGIGIIMTFIISYFIALDFDMQNKSSYIMMKSHEETTFSLRQILMVNYFKEKGNKHPEKMANAVLATNKPKLLAAIAVEGEKNTPYTVRRGGYKKRHAGAFQISQKHWGFVPYDPTGQALKAERILDELIAESGGDLSKALNKYGGDKTRKIYAKNILEEIANIP